MAGNNECDMTDADNGGKRGRRLEEGLPWPKRSDCSTGGNRGILDLDDKDACGEGRLQAQGWAHLLVAGAVIEFLYFN